MKHEFDDLKEKQNKVIEGVGEDAEVITNAAGGKQSKSPMALHLVDPEFLYEFITKDIKYSPFLDFLTEFLIKDDKDTLLNSVRLLASEQHKDALIEIGKVLQYGADRYEPNNWRLIPQEEHINHALIHYYAFLKGDTQDNHIEHCMCRLMMAYATEKSESFSYAVYIKKES